MKIKYRFLQLKKSLYLGLFFAFILMTVGCSINAPVTETTPSDLTSETVNFKEISYESTNLTVEDVIYFIMVDRFNDSNPDENLSDVNKDDLRAFQGGDLQGIIDKLDYIKDLGATAIWLTPIMENGPNGYHGYWIYDFYNVDPHFGDLEIFKTLVQEAHAKDLKVVLDYIVNHTGYHSPWLSDPEKKDWFNPDKNISNWKDKEEVERGWLAGLPDLNQDNLEVKNYLIENALWWIEETGIDGFRLDTVRHVPHEFWRDFSQAIKAKHPGFFLLGEVWDANTKTLESYHQVGIDSITNYSLYAGIENGFNSMPNMFSLINALDKEQHFTNPQLNAIFIDNHDNPRYMSKNPRMALEYTKQALTFMFTYPAIPVLYYGTEIGMSGAYDPENRQFMDWASTEDSAMLDFVKQLTDIRKSYMGTFKRIHHDKSSLVYEISNMDNKMLIVINSDEKEKEITFEYPADKLTHYDLNVEESAFTNGHFSKTLPPVSILFLIVD